MQGHKGRQEDRLFVPPSLTSISAHAIVFIGYDNKTETITYHNIGVGANFKMPYSELKALNFYSSNPDKYISIIICPKDINPDLPDVYL